MLSRGDTFQIQSYKLKVKFGRDIYISCKHDYKKAEMENKRL